MDSANSGSLQSSSGGEEEYDSRPNPNLNIISPFLNNPSSASSSSSSSSLFSSISNHPPTLFDPSQNNLHLFSHTPPPPSQTTNPLYNLDLPWTRNLRSEPNFNDFTPFSSSSSSTQSLLGVQGLSQGPFPIPSSSTDPTSTKPLQSDQPNAAKNPKKRTRASRRAPTTVLTTDTSNFRQMVQEFTGIPAAPFSAGSTYSRRLDLFGSGPTMRSSHLDTLGPLYPLRPSAQKVQLQPSPYAPPSSSPSPSFFLSPTSNNTTNITGSSSGIVGATSSQPQSLLNMQNNPIMSFQQQTQSLLGVEHVGGFHGSGDASQVRESWRDGGGGGGHYGNNNNNGSSDFNNHGRGMENASSRGEGTVDSWICPSD